MSGFFQILYNGVFHSIFFGIVLSIIAYQIGILLHRRFPIAVVNPLLIASLITVTVLEVCRVPYSEYKKGGDILSMWLTPATEILALNIYNKREILKKNLIPVITASLVAAVTCVAVIYGLSKLFRLEDVIRNSLLSKSVTTPIAIQLTSNLNGIQSITITALIISGIFGGMFAPQLVRFFHIKNPVAAGLGIGSCSHAVGTSTALQMGEVEGAMSSIAIGTMGLATTFVFIFL